MIGLVAAILSVVVGMFGPEQVRHKAPVPAESEISAHELGLYGDDWDRDAFDRQWAEVDPEFVGHAGVASE